MSKTENECSFLAVISGDRGQRYEVRFFDAQTGAERVFGWTTHSDGGGLMRSAKVWPAARDPWVIDRLAGREHDGPIDAAVEMATVPVPPRGGSGVPALPPTDLASRIGDHVNLDRCEDGDPCSFDHTCRIHKIRGILEGK